MSNNVYIINGDGAYRKLWESFGYKVVYDINQADVIQFTGGSDVNPHLYGEKEHPRAGVNPERDRVEEKVYINALKRGVKMAGICRGGQFLNVMNGGRMFQHCDGHAIHGTHPALIIENRKEVEVSSTHHQIMRPNYDKGIVLMESAVKFCRTMENMEGDVIMNTPHGHEVEAVFYPDTNCLCFQPHPEFFAGRDSNHPCVLTYKMFLRNYLELNL